MIGKSIESVVLNKEKDAITFLFKDGSNIILVTEADCCSSSWIEHLEMPDQIAGAVITEVLEDDNIPAHDNHKCGEKTCEHDCLMVYHTIFRTTNGDIVIEYRNDSNGYYGGNLAEKF